jgi:cyclopropane-fatty-acyl-phospholipid synthase
MFEHVGFKNYRTFMQVVSKCMDEDGICLLHTISDNNSRYVGDPWTIKYIFPNSKTPSLAQLSKALEGLFMIEDVHNIGPHYIPTCLAWYQNFQNAWPKLKTNYDERFFRMWRYYLLAAAGNFRARNSQVLQVVMTKIGRSQPNTRSSL